MQIFLTYKNDQFCLSRLQSARSEHRSSFRDQGNFPERRLRRQNDLITPPPPIGAAVLWSHLHYNSPSIIILRPVVKHQGAVIKRVDATGRGGDQSSKSAKLCSQTVVGFLHDREASCKSRQDGLLRGGGGVFKWDPVDE